MLEKIPDFNKIGRQLIIDAQTIAEVEMINFIMGNFERQGFLDTSIQPWQERKNNTDSGRAILTQSGALRDSVKISSSSIQQVVASSDSKYAKINNEGGLVNIPVTAKMRKFFWFKYKQTGEGKYKGMALTKKTHFTFTIPKRQFMGPSEAFNNLIDAKFKKMILQRFKN
ncbi:phage virion morphogenesis protein [Flavobacterium sp. IMCC34518]|uniref:phage virion morphogenesis protein n=1 Tax=Flavobacterium sp. IMCC34518 TaxID=3003623 RepID=UPI0024822C12|nr:phage virion morphogenesis protein [Flavobacterium sp. IMCC34518]